MKTKQIIDIPLRAGLFLVNQKGSHRQYKHPTKKDRVTVAGTLNDDVNPKTLKSIFRMAGLAR
ncbi:MAG: type II toxin-antitoxin system HicA family toxin [Deltaproteobacteria bacterium]|jgi:predicted RNA binding protein YcfA (HicA-like mRNA interferase family)|nr:type II toxin-antitoxin system HicA family toxin [Deltaproteobacteria bacterium]